MGRAAPPFDRAATKPAPIGDGHQPNGTTYRLEQSVDTVAPVELLVQRHDRRSAIPPDQLRAEALDTVDSGHGARPAASLASCPLAIRAALTVIPAP